jgi:hypothetical protein
MVREIFDDCRSHSLSAGFLLHEHGLSSPFEEVNA